MPPKKATATKKAAATTAAGNRPKRATAPVAEKQADTKTSGAGKSSHEQSRASRPRPSDLTTSAAANTGKKRGRPAKASEDVDIAEPPRKRGRPAKASENVDVTEPPRKRGRPSKASEPATPAASSAPAEKRGRPAKKEAPAVSKTDAPPPKKRGRPPKGGETTKIDTDDQAAAEQLEEELVDAVEEPKAPAKRGQGRPPKKAGGKKAAAIANDEDSDMADGVHETAVGTQYWLMKAEQEDREEVLKDGSVYNTKFTIDDLRDKAGPEPWDGVRNPTACKNMREMKLGDLAFFYASGGKKGRVPGIVGIMEVVKEHQADPSAFDEKSLYYVEDEKKRGTLEKPRWSMVHVEFRKKLSTPVTLQELKTFAEKGSVLSEMQEFTAARLSVSKVSTKEWNFIVNELIEGYETGTEERGPAGTVEITRDETTVVETIEAADTDITANDAAAPFDTEPKKPASRAGSTKAASRAGSTKSRTGSTNPLGPASVGRGGRHRNAKGIVVASLAAVDEEEG